MGWENTASLLPPCQPWQVIQLPLPEDEEEDVISALATQRPS